MLAEIPGRHRAASRGRRQAHPRRGEGRTQRPPEMETLSPHSRNGKSEQADGRIADNIVYFARTLRKAGLKVGPASVNDAIEAVMAAGIGVARRFLLDAACGARHAARGSLSSSTRRSGCSGGRANWSRRCWRCFRPSRPTRASARSRGPAETRVAEAMFEGHEKNASREEQPPEIEIDARLTVLGQRGAARQGFRADDGGRDSRGQEARSRTCGCRFDTVRTRRFRPSARRPRRSARA